MIARHERGKNIPSHFSIPSYITIDNDTRRRITILTFSCNKTWTFDFSTTRDYWIKRVTVREAWAGHSHLAGLPGREPVIAPGHVARLFEQVTRDSCCPG